MVKTIKALNYKNEVADEDKVEINENSVIFVQVITGDEVVRVFNSKTQTMDAFVMAGGRTTDCHDGEYMVSPDEFDKWMERRDVYDALETFLYERMLKR